MPDKTTILKPLTTLCKFILEITGVNGCMAKYYRWTYGCMHVPTDILTNRWMYRLTNVLTDVTLQLLNIIIMQLPIIHQRSRIMIVYHMISEVIQNNLICIIRFHGIDIPIQYYFNEDVKMKTVD